MGCRRCRRASCSAAKLTVCRGRHLACVECHHGNGCNQWGENGSTEDFSNWGVKTPRIFQRWVRTHAPSAPARTRACNRALRVGAWATFPQVSCRPRTSASGRCRTAIKPRSDRTQGSPSRMVLPKGHARATPRRTFAKDANLCAPGTRTVYYLAESLARKGARIISMRPRASQPVKDCAGCA